MVNTRLIVLNSIQIAGLLHDFIADNARELFNAKRITSSGTYSILNKNNTKMLCEFSQNSRTITLNDSELEKLLNRLPHTGFKYFEMSNKQIQDVINRTQNLSIEDLNFPQDNFGNTKNFRLFTLCEKEMQEILYKQMFEFIGKVVGFQTNNFNIGMKVDFDGENSKLIFSYSNMPFNIDLSKLDTKKAFFTFSNIGFDYKYVDLDENELKDLIIIP